MRESQTQGPRTGEYAQSGVDYRKIEPFKRMMIEVGSRTRLFPNRHEVMIREGLIGAHGGVFEYTGCQSHCWCATPEGLGNKNWIAEWMYQYAGTGKTYHNWIMWDNALMAINDVIAQGAQPVVYVDEVAAGDSDWFTDERRSQDLADGLFKLCEQDGIALTAGESPSLRYLVKAELPVKSAPVFSGMAIGLVAPSSRLITAQQPRLGDHIIGARSSGLHCNGISLLIKRALTLPDQFLTVLPDGRTLGDHALIPTRSYVQLVMGLLNAHVEIHSLLPGTGSGVSKVAFSREPLTYRITAWVKAIPPLFEFMRQIGVSLSDCLTTFNWGIGYYLFVPEREVEATIAIGRRNGYELLDLGRVEAGERQVIFEPEHITLPPPGE